MRGGQGRQEAHKSSNLKKSNEPILTIPRNFLTDLRLDRQTRIHSTLLATTRGPIKGNKHYLT